MRNLAFAVAVVACSAFAQSAEKCPALEREDVRVSGKNDEWTLTKLKLAVGDVLLIEAFGKVKVGGWIGEVTADGTADANQFGRLMLKIGTEDVSKPGARAFITSESSGEVKLKVSDSKYTDNSGAYSVMLIRIPACAIPEQKIPPVE